MNKSGKISGQAYQNRFGSWMKAIYAFCSDRVKNDSEVEDILNNVSINEENITSEKEIPIEKGDDADYIVLSTPRLPSLRLRFRVLQRDNFRCQECFRHQNELYYSTGRKYRLEIHHIDCKGMGGSKTKRRSIDS